LRSLTSALPKFVWQAVVLSLAVQVAAIALLGQYRIRATDNHFGFGWEMGCIGRALAEGRGFSDPYCRGTGPSAWEPPLYPALIGGVFKLFGIYSVASAWVLLTINSLFASLTSIPVYLIARRTAGEKAARWSVWTWALLPYTWYWSIHWVWETTITPLILSLIFLLALQFEEWPGVKGWIGFGVLWGIGALMNPSILSFLPFCGLWVWYRRSQRGLSSFGGVILASLVFFLCLGPWLVRNYRAFGRFVFIRDDFGQQLRLGNGPNADGILMAYLQPNLNAGERRRFEQIGELAYAGERKREAFDFIRENPGRFAVISGKRFVYYWAGVPKRGDRGLAALAGRLVFLASSLLALGGLLLASRQKRMGAGLFAVLLLSYPTVYYFVFAHARYRHPIEPELLILAVLLVSEARFVSRQPSALREDAEHSVV
jgi:4-amino-4-deoxy-L-arabinose transferase-like glycosyltransferase